MTSRYEDRSYGRYDREDDERFRQRESERSGRRSDYGYRGSRGGSRRSYGGSRLGRESDREWFGSEAEYERPGRIGSFSRESGRGYGATRGYEGDYEMRSNLDEYDSEAELRTRGGNAGYLNEYDDPTHSEPRFGTGPAFGGRLYGSRFTGGGYDYSRGSYREPSRSYSQRYNYPSGYRSGETYGPYLESERGYEPGPRHRDWLDRASDTVSSWFGDEEAERRRQIDKMREQTFRGRGPRGYKRSDERIKEDISDRLSDDPFIDATDVEVMVTNCEVTLIGRVDDRSAKRRAEELAEDVSGVTNVENRLRLKDLSTETTPAVGSTSSPSAEAGTTSTDTTEKTRIATAR